MKSRAIITRALFVLAFIGLAVGLSMEQGQQNSAGGLIEPLYEIREMRVTAYCACKKCCGKWDDGITASGHVIKKGDKFCAADRSYPFGTTVNIPEYGEVLILDRGGSIKGDRLDVFFGDANGISGHQRALNWGVKYLKVRIEQ